MFEQRFPDGWLHAGYRDAKLSTAFPSWDMRASAPLRAFTGRNQNTAAAQWSKLPSVGGIEGGSPLVLFDRDHRAVTLSPLDNFMAAGLEHGSKLDAGNDAQVSTAGVFSSVKTIPAGFVHPTVLVGGVGVKCSPRAPKTGSASPRSSMRVIWTPRPRTGTCPDWRTR